MDSFVPEKEMLEEGGDGIGVGSWRGDGLFGSDLDEEFSEGRSVPGAFDSSGAVGVGDLFELGHEFLADAIRCNCDASANFSLHQVESNGRIAPANWSNERSGRINALDGFEEHRYANTT